VLTTTRYRRLLRKIRAERPASELAKIKKAYAIASQQHSGQKRQSGDPYLIHPLEVATILAEMRLDTTAIISGLLHDTVEDTPYTLEQVREQFGKVVATIVDGVTNISNIDFASAEETQGENLRKLVLAMVHDVRVVLVKLADRLHNMRTIQYLPAARREKIARETLDIYAPIAHRLGMGKLCGELEELAFPQVDPVAYRQIAEVLDSRCAAGTHLTLQVRSIIRHELHKAQINARVEARLKRTYSVWQKIHNDHLPVEQIYDLVALRIITKSVQDCYLVLGMVHNRFRPLPGRVRDFIAAPRNDFYRSLHTTLVSPTGEPFEVQIRTEPMHLLAQHGIAAHWEDKDGALSARNEKRLAWLREVVKSQRDLSNPNYALSMLKMDLFADEIHTLTPKGKIIVLPRNATPIDFAYAIHSHIGDSCVGARVNARTAPLSQKLRTGDIVEILTQSKHHPRREWLQLAQSTRARRKVKQWLRKQDRVGTREDNREILQNIGLHTPPDLDQSGPCNGPLPPIFGSKKAEFKVRGHGSVALLRATCCSPIRGEPILAWILPDGQAYVHSESCKVVLDLSRDIEGRVEVEWSHDIDPGTSYPVRVVVACDNTPGMMKQIASVIGDRNVNINRIEAHPTVNYATVDIRIEVIHIKQLERILDDLFGLPGVLDVHRA
jgi:guanosine-3',5'-bis(diphosphate) 3'-pyrophosphohydrolase